MVVPTRIERVSPRLQRSANPSQLRDRKVQLCHQPISWTMTAVLAGDFSRSATHGGRYKPIVDDEGFEPPTLSVSCSYSGQTELIIHLPELICEIYLVLHLRSFG